MFCQGNMIEINSEEQFHDLRQKNSPVVVLFDAKWICSKGRKAVQDYTELIKSTAYNAVFAKIDVDAVDEDFVLDLGVSDLPHFSFYKNGNLSDQCAGFDMDKIKLTMVQQLGWCESDEKSASLPSVDYNALVKQVNKFTEGEDDFIANTANTAAAIWHAFIKARGPASVNWVGFYFIRPTENKNLISTSEKKLLVLGPFVGNPACKRIKLGSGVCGNAAVSKSIIRVADVHEFPGHIACDSASNSEIVVPIFNSDGNIVAVLDLDCPKTNGFSPEDAEGLSAVVKILESCCRWQNLELPVF